MEKEIFELYKELSPVDCFLGGLNECKDKLFIPSKKNVTMVIEKVDKLLKKNKDRKIKIILDSIKFGLENPEPFDFIKGLVGALFVYELKKTSLKRVYTQAKEGIKTLIEEYKEPELGVKVLTSMAISDLIKGIRQVERNDELERLLVEFDKKLKVPFKINQENILKNLGKGAFGRKKTYPLILKKIYNLPYTPEVVEKKNVKWFNEVLPEYKKVVQKIKKKYKLKNVDEIESLLLKRTKGDILKITNNYRKKMDKLVRENLVEISENHRVNVIITPEYLKSFIPIAAAESVNFLKGKFDNILFLTKDAQINKYFLIDVLVHEEFGHNVNFSNSYKVKLIDKLFFGTGLVIAEATAVYMERLFYYLTQKVKFSDEEDFDLFYSYIFLRRKLFVYLRAIADVRLNMEKQSVKEFMDWIYGLTGIRGDELFGQVFNRQFEPGYPTTYPLGVHILMDLKEKSKLSQKEFNTKAWSLGFPPLEVYRKLLKD